MILSSLLWGSVLLAIIIPAVVLLGVRLFAVRANGRFRALHATSHRPWLIAPSLTLSRSFIYKLILTLLLGAGGIAILLRFMFGIGAVSHMSDEFPWGIWIGFDVMGGVALAAGAFVIAGLAHIFGQHRLEPLVRPAILTGFLGYLLVVFGLVVDLGRPYNIWRPLFSFQHHSVMWEVGLCVATYTTVLFIEFLPVILERVNQFQAVTKRLPTILLYRILRKISIVFVILGVLLSTLHQSSLGSLWVLVPEKLYPLWYSIYLPVFFWLSAVSVGLAMTIVESTLSAKAFGHGLETDLLADLAKWSVYVLAIYLIAKVADLIQRGAWPLLFEVNVQAIAFWLEMILGVIIPMILFSIRSLRTQPRIQFLGAVLIVIFAVALNRLDIAIVAMWPWAGVHYLPSILEIAVTVSLVTFGVLVFALAAKYLPVFEESHD